LSQVLSIDLLILPQTVNQLMKRTFSHLTDTKPLAKNGKTFTFKVKLKEKKHKTHNETGIKLAPIRLCSRENHQQEYFVNFESKTRT